MLQNDGKPLQGTINTTLFFFSSSSEQGVKGKHHEQEWKEKEKAKKAKHDRKEK